MAIILGILGDRGHLTTRAAAGDVLKLVVPLDGDAAPVIQWRQRVAGVWQAIAGQEGRTAPLTVSKALIGYDLMADGSTPGGEPFTTQSVRIQPSGIVLRAPFINPMLEAGIALASAFTPGSYTHASGIAGQAPEFSRNGVIVSGATLALPGTTVAVTEVVTLGDGTLYRFPLAAIELPSAVPPGAILTEDGFAILTEDGFFILAEAA